MGFAPTFNRNVGATNRLPKHLMSHHLTHFIWKQTDVCREEKAQIAPSKLAEHQFVLGKEHPQAKSVPPHSLDLGCIRAAKASSKWERRTEWQEPKRRGKSQEQRCRQGGTRTLGWGRGRESSCLTPPPTGWELLIIICDWVKKVHQMPHLKANKTELFLADCWYKEPAFLFLELGQEKSPQHRTRHTGLRALVQPCLQTSPGGVALVNLLQHTSVEIYLA